jgi:hypothetical protein
MFQSGIGFKNTNFKRFRQTKGNSNNSLMMRHIKVGFELVSIWVVIELESKRIVGIPISKERNMFMGSYLSILS